MQKAEKKITVDSLKEFGWDDDRINFELIKSLERVNNDLGFGDNIVLEDVNLDMVAEFTYYIKKLDEIYPKIENNDVLNKEFKELLDGFRSITSRLTIGIVTHNYYKTYSNFKRY